MPSLLLRPNEPNADSSLRRRAHGGDCPALTLLFSAILALLTGCAPMVAPPATERPPDAAAERGTPTLSRLVAGAYPGPPTVRPSLRSGYPGGFSDQIPTPTKRATAAKAALPTATAAHPWLPPPTPLPTPTSTAVYPLAAFEARVRENLVAELDGRIEWSRLVTRAPLLELLGVLDGEVSGEVGMDGWLWDPWGQSHIPADALSDHLALVKASTYGLRTLSASQRWHGQMPDLHATEERVAFYVFFDAHSGRRVASIPESADVTWLDGVPPLAAKPPLNNLNTLPFTEVLRRDDSPEAEEELGLPSGEQPVAEVDSETPLGRALSNYPLLPGSTWVWRATSELRRVQWQRWWYTETVESAFAAGPETLIVRRRIDGHRGGPAEPDEIGFSLWHVTPRLALPYAPSFDPKEAIEGRHFRAFFEQDLPGDAAIIVEPTSNTFPSGIAAVDVRVEVIGQVYESCIVIPFVGGAGWGTYRWFCPGVGYVRSEQYSHRGNVTLHELMSFERAADDT